MGHIEELETRLAELAESGRVAWYPENLLEQLQRPDVRQAIEEVEEAVHHPHDARQAAFPPALPEHVIDWPVPDLQHIFFYVPNELVVAASAISYVLNQLRSRLSDEERSRLSRPELASEAAYQVVTLEPGSQTVPALAHQHNEGARAQSSAADGDPGDLITPHHVFTAGPMHCGGPGNDPDNRTAEHHDLKPLPVPSGNAGHGVVVAVLDSGILPPWELPAWVKDKVIYDSPDDIEIEYFDIVDGAPLIRYPRVHGTFVTGILLQVAPGATVLIKRLLDKLGTATDKQLGEALEAVLNRPGGPPKIINLSLGCPAWKNSPPPILADAMKHVVEHDPPIIVVAAAGNAGNNQPFWPAADPSPRILGVGAVNHHGERSEFSNFGPPVKVWALGEDVTSVYASGVFARELKGILHRPFAGLAAWGGTSFAAPRVAGLIARAITENGLPTSEAAAQHVLSTPPATDTANLPLPTGHGELHVPLVTDGLDI